MRILVDLLILGTAAGAGFCVAWWLGRGRRATEESELATTRAKVAHLSEQLAQAQAELQRKSLDAEPPHQEIRTSPSSTDDDVDLEALRRDAARTKDAIAQLQVLAQHMAEDVDEHTTRVQAINSELGEGSRETNHVVAAVTKLLEANAQLQRRLETAESKLERQAQQLQAQITEARTDSLTGLANRRAFDEQLEMAERAYHTAGRPACLVLLDVDNFKAFNDRHGHHAGDEVLRTVARTLQQTAGPEALVCRYGGEEFAILFPDAVERERLEAAERLRRAISDMSIRWNGEPLCVTVSAGIAGFQAGENAASLVKRADEALYRGKSTGRDRVYWHDGQQVRPLPLTPEGPAIGASHLDPLTGLATEPAFLDELERRLAEQRRHGGNLSVLLMELDQFDELAAAHDSLAGSTMLRATSQFLRGATRDMDQIARLGPSQFALLLPATRLCEAREVAERLRVAIEKCKLPGRNGLLRFTVSIVMTEAAPDDAASTLVERLRKQLKTARPPIKAAIGR